MKHVHLVSKTPSLAEAEETNFLALISIITLGFEVATVLFTAFGSVFDGLVSAITAFAASKNTDTM